MNSLFTIILFAIIFLSFLLVLVIMVQNPKGGGLSSSFGGGDSQQLGGVKQTGDFLDKSTWFLATALLLLILFSNITLNSGETQTESELLNSDNFEIEEVLEDSSPNTESENSLLNLKKKDNPFLKKLENKNKKDFFPDANVKEKRPERFINSNDLYLSRLNRRETESNKNINKFKVDQFLGEIRNDGEYVNIILRDHEYPDGDLIKVQINEDVVMPAILLTEKAKGFKLDLKSGFNVVDFVALNQGSSGPNTAEIIVYDDQGKLVGTNRWNLATGVKATYIIYKN